MFIKTSGRRVVVVGGGEQAAQKMRLLAKTDAKLIVLAETLNAELSGKATAGQAAHRSGMVSADSFKGSAMTFIATGCPGADASYHPIAKDAGAMVNVVDNPALCDMTTPSIVDRDPVVVAIGTEGTAPVLSRLIKTRIEGMLISNLGRMAAFCGAQRPDVDRAFSGRQRAYWAWVFRKAPMALFAVGRDDDAETVILDAIKNREIPEADARPAINIIGTNLQSHDLLTMRAVACLQEADVVFHEAEVDPAILELPRRDAERVEIDGRASAPFDVVADAYSRQAKGKKVAVLTAAKSALGQSFASDLVDAEEAKIIYHFQGHVH
ncbi:MAG: hypothetical protein JXQ85_01850 [Cognatishimia sp.]|uniref:NAD(P)-dependent oxidoreductase n=1 Tax=Cognatishimia sp. TaxID=2211648 RepID=UPI003B8C4595